MLAFAGGAMAASSKFAAHVSQAGALMHLLHSGVADTADAADSAKDCESGDTFFEWEDAEGGVCVKVSDTDTILSTTIKTANKKDLLIGVSLQSGLYTDTRVKGKNGSSEKAGAEAGIRVTLDITGDNSDGEAAEAFPTSVVFASRIQELSATLGGVIETCEITVDPDTGLGTLNIVNDCVVTEEEIGLILSTTSANHFNFVAPNLAPGNHTISVIVTALSSAAFVNGTFDMIDDSILNETDCDTAGGAWDAEDETCTVTIETIDNEAKAWAIVDIGSLTVEAVRATNNPDGITIDLDSGFCYDADGIKIACP